MDSNEKRHLVEKYVPVALEDLLSQMFEVGDEEQKYKDKLVKEDLALI